MPMPDGYKFKTCVCSKCGKLIKENWYVRHAKKCSGTIDALDQIDSLEFWMSDLLKLAHELQKDLKRFYEPLKGWPPHIQKLEGHTDYDSVLDHARRYLKGHRK